MHTIITSTRHLSQLVRRLIRSLRHRPVTLETRLVIAPSPFVRIEIGLKSEPPAPANDNHPRRHPRRRPAA